MLNSTAAINLPGRVSVKKQGRRRLLMISYFFPPLGGSGTMRSVKLAKYLPDYGWDPVVIAPKNPDWYYAADPGLEAELPGTVSVYRASMLKAAWIYRVMNPFRNKKLDRWIQNWLLHPDPQAGWIPGVILMGKRIIATQKIDAIFSTSAPLSAHIAAWILKKKTQIPWVADFRDEWFENPDFYFPTRVHKRFHYRLEAGIVRKADVLTAAAPGFCNFLHKHGPPADKCRVIIMGFDPADFEDPVPLAADLDRFFAGRLPIEKEKPPGGGIPEASARGTQRTFTIAFSGLFYGSFKPALFLEVVTGLMKEKKIPKDRIRILFVGANSPQDAGFKDDTGLCSFTGFLSHKEAVSVIRQCDALLLLLSRERGSHVIPSKTFEYLAAGKPILALVPPEGAVASIIREAGAGVVADFDDPEDIRQAFLSIYSAWEAGRSAVCPDPTRIACYDQRRITGQLASILDEVAR